MECLFTPRYFAPHRKYKKYSFMQTFAEIEADIGNISILEATANTNSKICSKTGNL